LSCSGIIIAHVFRFVKYFLKYFSFFGIFLLTNAKIGVIMQIQKPKTEVFQINISK
jgi:hypothetical protein